MVHLLTAVNFNYYTYTITLNNYDPLLALESGDLKTQLRPFVFLSNHNRRNAPRWPRLPYFPPVIWKGEVELSKEHDQECMEFNHAISTVVSFDSFLC